MGYRFLVVDRDSELTGSVEMMFSLLGHECRSIENPKKIAKQFSKYRPNVIFLEVRDDNLDVLHLLAKLRKKYSDQNWLSFLVLSHAYPMEQVKDWLTYTFSDGVVMKPYRVTTLVRLVERRVRKMQIVF